MGGFFFFFFSFSFSVGFRKLRYLRVKGNQMGKGKVENTFRV